MPQVKKQKIESHDCTQHSWGPWEKYDDEYHIRRCSIDEAEEKELHDWICTGTSEEYMGSKYQGGLEFDVYESTSSYNCRKCNAVKWESGQGGSVRGVC